MYSSKLTTTQLLNTQTSLLKPLPSVKMLTSCCCMFNIAATARLSKTIKKKKQQVKIYIIQDAKVSVHFISAILLKSASTLMSGGAKAQTCNPFGRDSTKSVIYFQLRSLPRDTGQLCLFRPPTDFILSQLASLGNGPNKTHSNVCQSEKNTRRRT